MPTREQVAAWRLCWDDAPQVVAMAEMLVEAMGVVLAVDTSPHGCPVCYAAQGDPHGGHCAVPRLRAAWRGEVDDADEG